MSSPNLVEMMSQQQRRHSSLGPEGNNNNNDGSSNSSDEFRQCVPDLLLEKVVVSQLLDSRRAFILQRYLPANPGALHHAVTKVVMMDILVGNEHRPQFNFSRTATSASTSHVDPPQLSAEAEDTHEALSGEFSALLMQCNLDALASSGETLCSLLSYDLSEMPQLEMVTLQRLRLLAKTYPVVTKEQIREAIAEDQFLMQRGPPRPKVGTVGPPDEKRGGPHGGQRDQWCTPDQKAIDRTVEYFFKFEKEVVPGAVVTQLVQKLGQPYARVRYSQRFVSDLVQTMRSLGSSIFYLALLIAVVVWLSQMNLWSRYATWLNASTPSEPWTNFCTHAGVINGSCHFETRTILDSISQLEATQFVHIEFVTDLWKFAPDGGSAADVPFDGSWLVGGLLMRLSPSVSDQTSSTSNLDTKFSCSDNNVSVPIAEPYMSSYFGCSSWRTTVIPFSATKEEALAMAEAFVLDVPQFLVASMILQYAMYSPSNGNIAWVTASLGIPKYGGVVPRISILVLDSSLHNIIETCMWCSLVLVLSDLAIFIALFSYRDGFFRALLNLFLRFALFAFIIASYATLRNVTEVNDLLQSEFVVRGLDTAVASSQRAEMLFALWIFALITIVAQFIGHIEGLQQVVKLIGIILPELLGLLLVFAFFYTGFLMVAMMVFGSTIDNYGSFFNANASLIQYFFVHFDLESFTENYPQIGFAYYYVFRMFLLFVVTNFCIVTIIAPIKAVWQEGDLPIIVANVIIQSKRTAWQRQLESLRLIAVNIVVFFINSTPLFLRHWLHFSQLLEDLYSCDVSMEKKIAASMKLLKMRDAVVADVSSQQLQCTPCFRVVRSTRAADHPVSFSLCQLVILSESRVHWLRDARQLHMLSSFDDFTTKLEHALQSDIEEGEKVSPLVEHFVRHDSVGGISDGRIQFHFTEYVLRKIQETDFFSDRLFLLFTVIDRLTVIGLYIAMVATIVSQTRDVAYLVRNLDSGIVELPFRQSCDDANCSSASTKPKTFADLRHIQDFRQFVRRRLQLSLYRSALDEELPNLSGAIDEDVVSWDSHIVRHGPVTFRQIRGNVIDCVIPSSQRQDSLPTAEAKRVKQMQQVPCSSGVAYSSKEMPRPADSLLPLSAYQFQASCAEVDSAVHGFFNLHWPCSGYTALIYNASQLVYAAEHWIDASTRLAAINMEFTHRGKSSVGQEAQTVQYNLYAEFSQGGSAGQFYVRSEPLSDPDVDAINRVGLILMSIDFALAAFAVYVPLLFVVLNAPSRLHRKAKISFRMVVYIVYLIVYLSTTTDRGAWTNIFLAIVIIVWFTYEVLFQILFPAALFFFRRVTMVNNFIALAFVRIVQLIPLFLMIVTAFAIGGYIMWGSRIEEFSTLHHSFLAVSQGILGDFELEAMYDRDSNYAMIFAILMLVVMVILALNLLLAVIAGCAEEARGETIIMNTIEAVSELMMQKVFFGPVFGVLLSKFVTKCRKESIQQAAEGDESAMTQLSTPLSGGRRVPPLPVRGVFAAITVALFPVKRTYSLQSLEHTRLPIPVECLAAHLGPVMAHEVIRVLHIPRQPEPMQCSSIALVLQLCQNFQHSHPVEWFLDNEFEAECLDAMVALKSPPLTSATTCDVNELGADDVMLEELLLGGI